MQKGGGDIEQIDDSWCNSDHPVIKDSGRPCRPTSLRGTTDNKVLDFGAGFQTGVLGDDIHSLYHCSCHGKPAEPLGIFISGTLFHRSEEHTSELQSRGHLVCRLLLE